MKVFIISGKARSGKSTLSELIKKYYENIGLKTIVLAYARYIKMYAQDVSDWDGSDETKPRELLQFLGTEIIRNKIGQQFFVKRIVDDIKIYSNFMDVAVISDARFIDEIEYPKKHFKDAITINIVKPNLVTDLTDKQQQHPSEISLNDYNKYDYVIVNDGTLEQLEEKVINILREN